MPRAPIPRRGFTRNPPAPAPCCASSVEEAQKKVRGTFFPTTALMENRSGLIVQDELRQAVRAAHKQASAIVDQDR